jgi:hypothetical protein
MSEVEHLRDNLKTAVDALRALNSAVWLDFPQWAIAKAETAKASEVVATWEAEWG